MSHNIHRRRRNGQFAPSLPLSTPAAPPSPPARPPRPYQRLTDSQRPRGVVMELTPGRAPTCEEVISVLNVARARMHAAQDNVSIAWLADLEPARDSWRRQAEIAEAHGDIPASDALYEVIEVSRRLDDYLARTPVFTCRHEDADEQCDECTPVDIDDFFDDEIAHYRDQLSGPTPAD